MTKSNEYLERRCAINEIVLLDLGHLIAAHLPAIRQQLQCLGDDWDEAIAKLDADIPDAPNKEVTSPIT